MYDPSGGSSDFNPMTQLDRALCQNDQATDEILDDVAQSKPETNTQCAGQHGQRCQFKTERLQPYHGADGNHRVTGHPRDGILQATIKLSTGQQTVAQNPSVSRASTMTATMSKMNWIRTNNETGLPPSWNSCRVNK